MELVLNTFGTSLNRDNEAFVVSNKKGRQRVPVDGVTSIQIGRGGAGDERCCAACNRA